MSTSTFDHVIIGGGMVASNAVAGIREVAPDATVLVLSRDADGPYTRPALSKKLWTDDSFTEEQVPLPTDGAEVRLGVEAVRIDTTARTVETSDGDTVGYGELLIATGGTPQRAGVPEDPRIIAFRSFADYRALRGAVDAGARRAVVVGGGTIGTEIAAALAQQGVAVSLVFPEEVLGGTRFPAPVAERYERLFGLGGVELLRGSRLASASTDGDTVRALLEDGSAVSADVLVLGLGISPDTALAEEAGLRVDDGIVVDEELRTTAPHVWAAGDVASYPDALLGRRRVEHVDNANAQGTAVGRSMAGAVAPYSHTPYFYSAVFGQRWEAVGELDPTLDTVLDVVDDDRLVAYHLDGDRVRGVLLWNVSSDDTPEPRDAARAVIAEGSVDRGALVGRIRPAA